jgi:hypothetical protein
MKMRRFKLSVLVLFSFCVLAGCVTLPPVPTDKNLLNDVVTPGISRESILLKLGEPSASFESGRILTYRIGEDNDHGYFLMDRLVRWTNTKYSLVLVFDEKGTLTKHSLIPVR